MGLLLLTSLSCLLVEGKVTRECPLGMLSRVILTTILEVRGDIYTNYTKYKMNIIKNN